MAAAKKYESDATQAVQQFAHAMRWADGDADRLQQLREALQCVVDPSIRKSAVLPDWYVSPELRLERALQLNKQRKWGFRDTNFPTVPADTGKLWLLVVNLPSKGGKTALQRTVDDRWDLIDAPTGYTKYRNSALLTDPDHLRPAPGYNFVPGIYWVEFDPDAYQGKSPATALKQPQNNRERLAGTEVLDAIWQFPDWVLTWLRNGKPAPYLSGLQFCWDEKFDWSDVLYVNRWDDYRRVYLDSGWAGSANDSWASPRVREY